MATCQPTTCQLPKPAIDENEFNARALQMEPAFVNLITLGDSVLWPAINLLRTLWKNLLQDINNNRFRNVPLTAPRIKMDLASVPEAINFMKTCGWEQVCNPFLDFSHRQPNANTMTFTGDISILKQSKQLLDDAEKIRERRLKCARSDSSRFVTTKGKLKNKRKQHSPILQKSRNVF